MRSKKSKTKPVVSSALRWQFEAIGTHWDVEIFENIPTEDVRTVRKAIAARIEEFDQAYSRFRADSWVSHMAHHPGTYQLPHDAHALFDIYHTLYKLTDGTVTPLIGQSLSDAGYDAHYSLKPQPIPSVPAWDEALDYRFPELILKKPVLLDFGAAGKGYLLDLVAAVLCEHNIVSFCLNAGGDIVHHSASFQPIHIALEHPTRPEEAIGVVELGNKSLCGSAGNRRAWGGYHHILDAHTLVSPHHIAAVWVVAETGLVAEALATALFFAPPERLAVAYTFEYAIVHADFSLQHSPQFPAHFFTGDTL